MLVERNRPSIKRSVPTLSINNITIIGLWCDFDLATTPHYFDFCALIRHFDILACNLCDQCLGLLANIMSSLCHFIFDVSFTLLCRRPLRDPFFAAFL